MAKIHEENILIKVCKLVKDNDNLPPGSLVNADLMAALQSVVEELAGQDVVVEIENVYQ